MLLLFSYFCNGARLVGWVLLVPLVKTCQFNICETKLTQCVIVFSGVAGGLLAFFLPDYVTEQRASRYRRVAELAGDDVDRYLKNDTACTNYDALKDSYGVSLFPL